MKSEELSRLISEILDEKKASDIEIIRVDQKTTLTDYFLIASGTSTTQVRTLADEVEFRIKEKYDIVPRHIEGMESSRWVLLDYIDVVVHIFLHTERDFYKLDRLWNRTEEMKLVESPTISE